MTLRVALFGAGRWGRTLARSLVAMPEVSLVCVVDPDVEARERARAFGAEVTDLAGRALCDPSIDAVFVATPPATHAPLVEAALAAGKHVFVEKPLCLSMAEGRRIERAAGQAGRAVLVGHLMLYHPAVAKLRELVRDGILGRLRYLYATRVNLGTVRTTESVWWSLAPHDVSMVLALVGEPPERVSARGVAFLQPGIEDVVFAQLEFPSGVVAHLHVSWLEPHKRRELTIVGSRRAATFDDMQPSDKVRVFDIEAGPRTDFESFAELVALRQGDIAIPRLEPKEPLRAELEHFVAVVRGEVTPRTCLASGLDVMRVLEAGQRSLEQSGATTAVERD